MKTIYLDTEFSEGFFKPIGWLPKWFPGNKPRWSIELISIGLVDDEGKEYYAINQDFKRSRCNDWVKENVLTKLPERMIIEDNWWDRYHGIEPEDSEMYTPNPVYKSIAEIREDIQNFVYPKDIIHAVTYHSMEDYKDFCEKNPVQFKAYYADYDWVLFCTIFGTMMDLPDGFPMYAIDIKQIFDETAVMMLAERVQDQPKPGSILDVSDGYELTIKDTHKLMKEMPSYPKQNESGEHNAVEDAKWNKQVDEWLTLQRKFL